MLDFIIHIKRKEKTLNGMYIVPPAMIANELSWGVLYSKSINKKDYSYFQKNKDLKI